MDYRYEASYSYWSGITSRPRSVLIVARRTVNELRNEACAYRKRGKGAVGLGVLVARYWVRRGCCIWRLYSKSIMKSCFASPTIDQRCGNR